MLAKQIPGAGDICRHLDIALKHEMNTKLS